MAIITRFVLAFILALALAMAKVVYSSQILKGSVTCIDCPHGSNLSGFQVLVKCDKVKKLAMTYTNKDGAFETELPSDDTETKSSDPAKCMAKIMGGPDQLYIPSDNAVIPVAKSNGSQQLTLSKPLSFYKACPEKGKCDAKDTGFGESDVAGVPPSFTGQGGAPAGPSRFYIPFIPIIGIP